MNCAELQQDLPDILESGGTAEQQAHLKYCSNCADLLSDLNAISEQARLLQGFEEPSPRVWNSLEIALRQEGLIREPKGELAIVHGSAHRWRMTWVLPAAATLAVVFGVLRYEGATAPTPAAQTVPPVATVQAVMTTPVAVRHFTSADDEQLLEMVGSRVPAMRASYERNLRRVNAYIRDAEQSAQDNPNDEEAQQYLMNAYEQKAMVYDMAMDRSVQ